MKHALARTALQSFALVSVVGASSKANVLVVDAGGGGGYTQISAAVAAATDGDVLLVRTGGYTGFSIGSKALDVVADASANVQVNGPVSVSSIGASRTVTLTGLTILGTSSAPALVLASSSGSIRVQGCTVRGFDQQDCVAYYMHGGTAASVTACSDVTFAACTLDGGDPADLGGYVTGWNGGEGLVADSSSIALYDSDVSGGNGASEIPSCPHFGECCAYGGDGGDGVNARLAPIVFLSNCNLRGGNAGVNPNSFGYTGCSGSGIYLAYTGPGSGSNARSLQSTFTEGNNAVFCLDYHDDIVVRPGSTFGALAGISRRATATRVAREQQPARIDFFGQPGDQVLLTVAEAGRFVYVEPQRGVRLLRTRAPTPVQIVGTIGASGTLSSAWIVPELGAGVQARRFLLQAQFVDASGQATLGPPSTMVLVDSAF